jgi:4-amino-4-deoxy-L-arabinose transferase-like glycosyltransferase
MNRTYAPLWIFIAAVLITGMFFPKLMDTDAPEYASIAMHMEQQDQWGTVVNRTYNDGQPYDYLDKPHVLYWSAWPGFKLFGITDAGYRLGSILMSLLAALATLRLGALLYNKRVGQMAALMFLSTQAIILANHDVRTDSLLASFVVLAVWQLVLYVEKNNWINLIWAGAFLAGGVGTKGMIAALVTGSVLFFYLLGKKDWKHILEWKWLLLVGSFFLFLSPVLYLYYVQFDLHPEKFVNGGYGTSGIKFILWTQSFERFAGDRQFVDNPEFSFFFHTLLWALLPWSIICYGGVLNRMKNLFATKGSSFFSKEQLTFAGVWAMFLLMSKSSFKLPHYLNVLFPFMCIFTAGYLFELFNSGNTKSLRLYRGLQWVVIGALGVLLVVINGWAFPVKEWWIILLFLVLCAVAFWYFRSSTFDQLDRVWIPSAVIILLVNVLLNTNFYPQVDQYQAGSSIAQETKKQGIPVEDIYLYSSLYRSFDFYLNEWRPMLTEEQIMEKQKAGNPIYLFTNEEGLQKLKTQFRFDIVIKNPDFHITGLNGKFLNPSTRDQSYKYAYLVKL